MIIQELHHINPDQRRRVSGSHMQTSMMLPVDLSIESNHTSASSTSIPETEDGCYHDITKGRREWLSRALSSGRTALGIR